MGDVLFVLTESASCRCIGAVSNAPESAHVMVSTMPRMSGLQLSRRPSWRPQRIFIINFRNHLAACGLILPVLSSCSTEGQGSLHGGPRAISHKQPEN